MTLKTKNIMVILPTPRDRNGLSDASDEYNIHWMDDDNFDYPYPKDNFDMVEYTERCSKYIEENNINGILYSHDLANLVAGVLCDRHDIDGPSLESVFLTNHKYYSRRKQPNTIWSDYIDLETGEWGELEPTFPCYIKPACLMMSLYQYTIETPEELEKALKELKKELPSLLKPYNKFFEKYIDLDKYPLANKNIVVVEELVENANQHCVEGWFDPEGNPHIWAISDQIYYPGKRKSIDVYTTPSVLPKDIKSKMKEYALQAVNAHGIDSGFWNVEIWRKGDWLTATEVNGRAASVWFNLYKHTFDISLYKAMLYLCCNEGEKCYNESPKSIDEKRIGGQFHVITYGEGLAEEFLDFDYIQSVDEPEIEVFAPKGTKIEQKRTTGYWLARFHLFGEDYNQICKEADQLRENMLKQPELSPQPPERNKNID